MVNAPFKKYTISKAQWKSLVETASLPFRKKDTTEVAIRCVPVWVRYHSK